MTERTTVAIVGGGPVGLFLAAELGVRGVETIVLTDGLGTSAHPKANTHTARSMEIYRRHGISAALRAGGLSKQHRTDVAYFTRLRGHELHRVPLPTPAEALAETRAPGTRWPTPEPQFRSSQIVLEPLLLSRARSFPTVDVRFRHRVTGLEQDADSVDLAVTNDDETRSVRARYVVGCDGGRSTVRSAIGAQLGGVGALALDFMGGRMEATYFRAPGLQHRLRHAYAWQSWFLLPHLRALLVTLDAENDLYLLHYQLPPEPQTRRAFEDVLTEIVGEPTACEVMSSADWRAGVSLVADRFRLGNVFLAGDAAHLFTPTGGFGVNTGIEDAFNLGWKLAAVIGGWAPQALLDTYAEERRPIAERNTSYALTLARRNGECPVSAAIEDDGPAGENARSHAREHLERFARWEFDTPGIQLGVSYRGSRIVVDDGSPAAPDPPTEYVPNAVPGSRLPHVWLADGSALFDRLGPEFTLVAVAPAPPAWAAAAAAAQVPLTILTLPDEPELRRLARAPLVLVRPDQYVAWRGSAIDDPGSILDAVTGTSLERSLETA